MSQPINYSDTTPAAPSGKVNNKWQADTPAGDNVTRNVSTYTPIATATTPGAVPTPPNDGTKFLAGDMTYKIPAPCDLQTNGSNNGSQVKLNLISGSNITITDGGTGGVTIAASSGGGGGDTPSDLSGFSVLNASAGTLGAAGPSSGYTDTTSDVNYVIAISGSPSTWSIAAKLNWASAHGDATDVAIGIALWQAIGNLRKIFFIYQNNTAYIQNYNNGSYSGSPFNTNWFGVQWLKVSADGAHFYYQISPDGTTWKTIYTEAYGTFCTPDHYGFIISPQSGVELLATVFNLAKTP